MALELSCAFATSMETPSHVELAERLGYRTAWCYDSPALYPDVWVMLALAAQRTSTIRLGPGVLVPSLRHVMTNAAAIATLEGLAPGRVVVAVGGGDRAARPGAAALAVAGGGRVHEGTAGAAPGGRGRVGGWFAADEPPGHLRAGQADRRAGDRRCPGPEGSAGRRRRRGRDLHRRRDGRLPLGGRADARHGARRRRGPRRGPGAAGRRSWRRRLLPPDVRRPRLGRRHDPARERGVRSPRGGAPRGATTPRHPRQPPGGPQRARPWRRD